MVIFTDGRIQCSSWNSCGDKSEVYYSISILDPSKTGLSSTVVSTGRSKADPHHQLLPCNRSVLSISVVYFDFLFYIGLPDFTLIFVFIHSFMDCARFMLVMVWYLPV